MAAERKPLLLIQFARAPVVGQVKTRMLPHLSAQAASDLHAELVLWTCRRLLSSSLGPLQLSVSGATTYPLFDQCRAAGVATINQQSGKDLGERMHRAMASALESYARVILVGSDCPGIDSAYLTRAATSLDDADVVLGPASDGGYVLIGAKRITPVVFEGIPWGTDTVFARTVAALEHAQLGCAVLPELADIDRPEDLPLWQAIRDSAAGRESRR